MSDIHAQAFNLARRDSIKNENDLMQVNFFEEEDEKYSPMTEKYCISILQDKSLTLPLDCQRFESVRSQVRRQETINTAIAFQGMNPHETLEAIRSRERGRPHHAQLQRRMTSQNQDKKHDFRWF